MVRLELRELIERGCVLFMRYGGGQGKSFTMSSYYFMYSASPLLSTSCCEALCYDEGHVATVGRGTWAEW